jgi:hypothetical protein
LSSSGVRRPRWYGDEPDETALSGTPPETIAEELRDLLLQVYFEQSPRKKRRPLSTPPRPGQQG